MLSFEPAWRDGTLKSAQRLIRAVPSKLVYVKLPGEQTDFSTEEKDCEERACTDEWGAGVCPTGQEGNRLSTTNRVVEPELVAVRTRLGMVRFSVLLEPQTGTELIKRAHFVGPNDFAYLA